MTLVSRIRYPETCTFSVSQSHNPMDQYMYECVDCGQTLCLVCRDLCHPFCAWENPSTEAPIIRPDTKSMATLVEAHKSPRILRRKHTLRALGFVAKTYCCCKKTSCRAIGSVCPRESAGFTWTPSPIDTRSVSINIEAGSELGMLVEKLAWNSHEVGFGISSDQPFQ